LFMLFAISFFVLVGLAIVFKFQQIENTYKTGYVRADSDQLQSQAAAEPSGHLYDLKTGEEEGGAKRFAKIAAPKRWPKVEQRNDSQGGMDANIAWLRSSTTQAMEGTWEAIFDSLHGEERQAGGEAQGENPAGEADNHLAHMSDLKIAGHLCPFVHTNKAVTCTLSGEFCRELLGPQGDGNLQLMLENDVGQQIFTIYVEPCQQGPENLFPSERRKMMVAWVNHHPKDYPPLACLRPLDKNSVNEKEKHAASVEPTAAHPGQALFGIWDMSDKLTYVIKVDYDSEGNLCRWDAHHIHKKDDGSLRLRMAGCLRPSSSHMDKPPCDPVNMQTIDVKDGHDNEQLKQRVGVLRSVGGGPDTKDNLAIMSYEKTDMVFIITMLIGSLMFQRVDASEIAAFKHRG
jgi:hypothetical protein